MKTPELITKFNENILTPVTWIKIPSNNSVVNRTLLIIFIFPAIALFSILFTVWIFGNVFLILLYLSEISLSLFANMDLFDYLKKNGEDIYPEYYNSNEEIIIIDDNNNYEENDDISENMEDVDEGKNDTIFMVNSKKLFIDGTNVIRSYRQDVVMDGYLCILLSILIELNCQEIDWCVIFDANTEYFLQENFPSDNEVFDLMVKNPKLDINVIFGGSQADEYLLALAEKEDAYILTNDRFRDSIKIHSDWGEKHPERLVKGKIIKGQIVIPQLRIIKKIEYNAKQLYETIIL